MQDTPSAKQSASIRSEGATDTAALKRARYISITTFHRNGEGVATPVEFVERRNAIYVRSRGTGKVKRIRNNPRVRVAPCTMRGRETAPAFDGVASLLSAEEGASLYSLFSEKYGFLWRLGIRIRRPKVQGVKIVLAYLNDTALQ